jgi:Animal haem peroxidase/RTX calcium-binding nonapeptide repeat (4 copies)
MASSFTINIADLNKILTQIKIAETNAGNQDLNPGAVNAAGIDLVTIIGQDAALLPQGLRTVSGVFNHLLPGQSLVGAADQPFPRLLPQELRTGTAAGVDFNGDGIPDFFGAAANAGAVYSPLGTVVDSQPRTISNLIVDQSINNPAAIAAALQLLGSADPTGEAFAIVDAGKAARAAAPNLAVKQATETVYETAMAQAALAQTQINIAQTKLTALLAGAGDGTAEPSDVTLATEALAAANASSFAAQSAVTALLSNPNVTPADLAAAQAYATSVAALAANVQTALTSLGDGTITVPEFLAIDATENSAIALSTSAATLVGTLTSGEATAHAATVVAQAPSLAYDALIANSGITLSPDGSIDIINKSPDIGLSPSFNGFMTFFGQFFDHGLDLVPKGGNGNVYIPLMPDDPLYVEGSPTNFMVISRLIPNAINITTPFVDQNQTYTSHASHQVFLREYAMDGGVPIATGRLLGGTDGGLPKWADVKAQAHDMLGIQLVDADILRVPLLATDEYGRFIRGSNGFVQIVTATGLVEANPADNGGLGTLIPVNVVKAGTAFLDDIAHNAAPGSFDPDGPTGPLGITAKTADLDDTVGSSTGPQPFGTYDDELLNQHFITGDGRGNENIGLTTVHTVFHNEHDRLVEDYKGTILATGDLALINQWLDPNHQLLALPAPGDALIWNGERLFQAGRFVTEMQYQHLVFEEFARKVQPNVDPFVFTNSATLDPSIVAEFAHTVYRFGHSMLSDTVDRLDNDLTLVGTTTEQIGLIEAFLNPVAFSMNNNGTGGLTAAEITLGGVDAATAGGAILRGMTRQVGNEIDEFVVDALRNNLVGLPLDLAAINMARGRDAGIPTLNHARTELYAMTSDAQLKPYTSWFDFAQNIKHPESIINFIAAYGTHTLITAETTVEGKRAAAMAIVFGVDQDVLANPDMVPPVLAHTIHPPADALAFLNATGAYAPDGAGPNNDSRGGLDNVDLWVGGLAEEKMEFGGMLGSTFGAVFEYQMEHLQNGDRFYYLSRTQGMNLLNQLEPSTFSDLVMRNTDLGGVHSTHISAIAFDTPDLILELDTLVAQEDYNGAAAGNDVAWTSTFQQLLDPKVVRINGTTDINGDGELDGNVLKFSGGEHVVLGGTEGNDTLIGDKGIDTLWGDGGDDYLNAGMESDQVFGGEGDDIIEDPFGDNFLRGNQGNDVISSGHGLSILFGDTGQDAIIASTDTVEVFAGEGNDFILGGSAADGLMGNEGDDWIEGGEGFDGLSGENSELFFNSPIVGHDILNGQGNDTDYDGENGDDIMVQGAGIQRNNGMQGFDWAIHKGDNVAADSDLSIGVAVAAVTPAFILRDRFDSVEGLSGWKMDDVLTGNSKLLVAGSGFDSSLNQAGVDRIHGLAAVIGAAGDANPLNDPNAIILSSDRAFAGGEILLGGAGSDVITGNLGDDIIDGDAWLNVKIDVHSTKINPVTGLFDAPGDHVLFSVDSLTEIQARLLSRGADHINPGQLQAVREIINDSMSTDGLAQADDVAVFNDISANYTITRNVDGSITVTHDTISAGLLNSDGIDTLRNMEVARFTDADVLLVNRAATGAPALSDLSPTETLTVSVNDLATISDANGISSPFSFQWQSSATGLPGSFTNIAGATAITFTPNQARVGQFLQVSVSFTDGLGNLETVVSAPSTRVVGDAIVSDAATVNGTAGDDLISTPLTLGVSANVASIFNGGAGDDRITAGRGNDTVNAGGDNDTIIWNASLLGLTPDGRDIVDGGLESVTGLGDTFVINGSAGAETYRVYSAAFWTGLGGATHTLVNAGTEIVITRGDFRTA